MQSCTTVYFDIKTYLMINWHEKQANFCVNDSNFNFSRQKLYEKLAQKND